MKKIYYITIYAIHGSFLLLLFCASPSSSHKQQRKLSIRTISPPAAPSRPHTQSKTITSPTSKQTKRPVTKKSSPAKKPALPKKPSPQKKKPAQALPKNPIPSSKPTDHIARKTNISKTLQQLEESIAKIEEKNVTMLDSVNVEDKRNLATEYTEELIQYMRAGLQLSDIGDVQVELVLQRDGTVLSMRILSAQSEQNRKRIEQTLPSLQFPPLPYEEKTGVFILTFCNE